ncbi:efflux RND transporter periplasmic adaptor subunit [Fulvimarina sp. 2208YS6-2-32]|uniref:Efflux RND transporter periplasmic adaptor subunit n=1 Tax=Fulvimarina uroteuthidis TaxID=3098149 RepID=A0ABU5I8H1_9HYPH|nr:efflux RND transporter periplasmic adaptor subunit [Fulvimarina sp. 2208YS6-2-32]MDY8111113.1 efflux RND transporter periplasmic adaptor subunit [Fulvimarina sp. 2208YS6-2-32]
MTARPERVSRTTSLTGEIVARHTATYAFETSGRVAEVAVDVGAKVKAGDLLASLDPVQQRADVSAAEAAVASARARARQASGAFERQKALFERGYTTRGDFDDAEKALSSATSAVDTAVANLETARTNLENTVLRADANGVVTSRSVDPGQVVSAAQTAFGFAEDGPRDAVFDIQEQLLIGEGKAPPIRVSLVGDPSVETTGTVREVSPLISPETGTVRIKVGLDAVPPRMSLGSAVVGMSTETEPGSAIVLPWTSLMADGGKTAVWTVEKGTNAARLTPVTVGYYESATIIVKDGIEAGDRVVTQGSQLVRPGQVLDLVSMDGDEGAGS